MSSKSQEKIKKKRKKGIFGYERSKILFIVNVSDDKAKLVT